MEKVYVDDTMLVSGGKRFGNYVIDLIIQYALSYGLGLVAVLLYELFEYDSFYNWISEMGKIEEYLLGWAISFVFYSIFEGLLQRTPGKFITRTRVVMEDGSKPPFGKILLRSVCRFIPFEHFTFFGDYSRGLHDRLSDTYVVDINAYEHAVRMKQSFEEIGTTDY